MLVQILSTFGLALLRYAFWIFSVNFVSLPQASQPATQRGGHPDAGA
jgi:hypothetical protein